MTTSTVRPGWPPFRSWQEDHALHHGDLDRYLRLRARWSAIAAYIVRRLVAAAMAGMAAAFRRIGEALAAAFRQLADALRPALDAFAALGRALGTDPA